jgi:hypothetical protein
MDPITMMAIGGGLSSLFGGGASTPPQSQQLYTPEMRDEMLNYLSGLGGNLNSLYGTQSYAPGGISTQQASQISPQQQKATAYVQYLQSQGFSPENAQKKANQIIASKKEKFADDKGFKQWLKTDGAGLGLKVGGGKIAAGTKIAPGGVNATPQSELLNAGFQNLSGQALQAASGLPALFGQDTARALQAKQGLQGMLGSMLGQGFTGSGLLPSETADLSALENFYMQKFGDLQRDTTQKTVGDLVSSGFSSSNLAADALQKGAYDSQSRFLTEAMAALAGKQEDLVNQRFNRQSQNMSNIMNAFNTLGANQGIGGITGAIMSPGQAGLFTDPQSAALAAQLQQQNIGNNLQYGQMMQQGLSSPVQVMPEGPGLMSTMLGGLAGLGGAYLGGKGLSGYIAANKAGTKSS